MLSHAVKKMLDNATGLKFSPVIGMSESYPIASYSLTDISDEVIKKATLEVRLQGEDFDELEEIREKIKTISVKECDSNILMNDYSLRIKLLGGGGVLPSNGYFDSTQYFEVTYFWCGRGVFVRI